MRPADAWQQRALLTRCMPRPRAKHHLAATLLPFRGFEMVYDMVVDMLLILYILLTIYKSSKELLLSSLHPLHYLTYLSVVPECMRLLPSGSLSILRHTVLSAKNHNEN